MVPLTGPAHSVPSVLAMSPTGPITTISLALPCLLTGCVQSFVIDLPTCSNWTNYLHHTDPTHHLLLSLEHVKGFLTCSYLKLFKIALSPPLINRNSVQNHLNYPTEPQPITDSCHNNSLPLAYLLLKPWPLPSTDLPIHHPCPRPTTDYAYCSSITGPASVISLCPTQFPCILTPTRPMYLYEDQLLTTLIGLFMT